MITSLRKPWSTFINLIGETGKGDHEAPEIISRLAVEVHDAGDIVRDAIMLQGTEMPALSSGAKRDLQLRQSRGTGNEHSSLIPES